MEDESSGCLKILVWVAILGLCFLFVKGAWDCEQRGGAYVRSYFGGYDCVERK